MRGAASHVGMMIATSATVFALAAACLLWLGASVVVEALRFALIVTV